MSLCWPSKQPSKPSSCGWSPGRSGALLWPSRSGPPRRGRQTMRPSCEHQQTRPDAAPLLADPVLANRGGP
eukprot:scaffold544_cov320-Pavlova_lutheri.AAC.42